MVKKNLAKVSATVVASSLEKMLKVEANTTSCALIHQPKAPKELKQFRSK